MPRPPLSAPLLLGLAAFALAASACGGDPQDAADAAATSGVTGSASPTAGATSSSASSTDSSSASVTGGATLSGTATGTGTPGAADGATTTSSAGGSALPSPTGLPSTAAAGDDVDPAEIEALIADAVDGLRTVRLSVTTTGGDPFSLTGKIDYTHQHPAMDLAVVTDDTLLVRRLGTHVFVSTEENRWTRYPLDDPSKPMGQAFAGFDPLDLLGHLATGLSQATGEGRQKGRDTYRVVADAAALRQALEDNVRGAGAPTDGPATLPVTVGFDDKGRPKRFAFTVGDVAFTVLATDWSRKVTVTAPPKDQVTEG